MIWLIALLAVVEGGWMAFDGWHALTTGDYVTPQKGRHAGQLGPWAGVVSKAGIPPRSSAMKLIFAVYGTAWMVVMICFLLQIHWAWMAMLIAAIGAIWYLPFGTLLSVIQIVLLLLPARRRSST